MIANLANISQQQKGLIDTHNLAISIEDNNFIENEDNIELEIEE